MVVVEALDPHDPARFEAWYTALRAGACADRHAPVVVSAKAMRAQLTDQTWALRRPFGVFDGATCLGAAVLEWDTEQNTHLGELDVNVAPEHRGAGVGTALLHRAQREAETVGLRTLTGEVNVTDGASPGLRFARSAGFDTVHTEDHLVLDLPLTASRLAELAAAGDAADHGYTVLSWTGPTPPDQQQVMAELMTAMNVDVPAGDTDAEPEVVTAADLQAKDIRFRQRGYLRFTTLVHSPQGPAGYSQVFASTDEPAHVMQDDTYVAPRHRGRRIGAWLKATNLAVLQRNLPEARYVHTWTAGSNSAMQALNARFGFRRVEVMHEVQSGGR